MWLATWLALATASGYFLAWHDKRRASRRDPGDRPRGRAGSRIPERRFLLVALLGGGLGAGAAFILHRHKTRKRSFLVPFWATTAVGAAIAGAAAAMLC